MSGAPEWRISGDEAVLVLTVTGELGLPGVARLRTGLLKCLAEQPGAVLVDLSGMSVSAPTALTVFAAVSREAAAWPATPVLLCAPTPPVAALLAGCGTGRLPTFPSVDAARDSLGGESPWPTLVVDDLLPVAGAARHARDMVTEACGRWSVPHLAGPASLILSELVANAIDHAGSMMTVRISLRSRYLHLAVQDGSPQAPVRAAGAATSGLGLVDAVATGWGCLVTGDGKVVWAVLATDRG